MRESSSTAIRDDIMVVESVGGVSIMRASWCLKQVIFHPRRKFFVDRVFGYAKIRPNGEAALRCDTR
jgi:hypothetical protein